MYKDFLPKKEDITKHQTSWLGKKIHDRNLWKYNIESVPRGIAIGIFVAFIPLPMQMFLAVILGTICRANLPLAVICTWITNPITFIPINYFIHDFGEFILNVQHNDITIDPLDFSDFSHVLQEMVFLIKTLGKPFIVGLPIVAFGAAFLSYTIITVVWYIAAKISKSSLFNRT